MERTPSAWDDEWRVFYVAVTRARKRLYILERTGENGIDL
jgi:ATP-dependent exoDNAse (exonuclease V) beta subunit